MTEATSMDQLVLLLRRAYHWSGDRCWQGETCPDVDECCHAEDDGSGPDSVERWESVAANLSLVLTDECP